MSSSTNMNEQLERKRKHEGDDGDHKATATKRKKSQRHERKRKSLAAAEPTSNGPAGAKPHLSSPAGLMEDNSMALVRKRSSSEKRNKKQKKSQKLQSRAREEVEHEGESMVVDNGIADEDALVETTGTSNWQLSGPSAGRFLNQDPVFVQEEDDMLVAATKREVQLLSIESSLVVDTFPAPEGCSVSCFAARGDMLYTAFSDNTIWESRWLDDEDPRCLYQVSSAVKSLTVSRTYDSKATPILYYICRTRENCTILAGDEVIHSVKHKLESIQILGGGKYVIAWSPTTLVLGARKHDATSGTEYTWLEIPLAYRSTCIATRVLPAQAVAKSGSNGRDGLQLAIGYDDGKIQLHDDVSHLFRRNAETSLPTPRILHWHREAVLSMKFSADGNYLISGGNETVLVLWQLGTGNKQFLPHLSAKIDRVVVNTTGDRYAVQMGDNSIMVLNTSELKPVANFAGLQTLCQLPHSGSSSMPAVTLRNPNHLLVTVPATQPKSKDDLQTRPFLQTFDLRSSRHVTRQALTRNNVTDFNLGPERTPILSPDVTHIAISRDGNWLATVDEWTPPEADLQSFAPSEATIKTQQTQRKEVYLKFWQWDEAQSLWTLTTRVDSPHARNSGASLSGAILALVSNPVANGFATIGIDSCVRLWKSKTRTRHGVAVKSEADDELAEWVCGRTCPLENGDDRADSATGAEDVQHSTSACLAYSADGSMLAASQTFDEHSALSTVHFIDTATGAVTTKPGLAAADISALGFLGQYLVVSSAPATYVWDLVSDRLMHRHMNPYQKPRRELEPPMLAVNDLDGTFAIVTPRSSRQTTIEVYKATQKQIVHKEDVGARAGAVLAGARGYTLLFVDGSVRTLSHAMDVQFPTHSLPPPPETPQYKPQEDVEMVDIVASARGYDGKTKIATIAGGEEDDRPVVQPEQLAELFDREGVIMPPVKDMFQAIVGLFGRKPVSGPRVEAVV